MFWRTQFPNAGSFLWVHLLFLLETPEGPSLWKMLASPGLLLYSTAPKYGLTLSRCASPLLSHLLLCTVLWGSPASWFKPYLLFPASRSSSIADNLPPGFSPARSTLSSTPFSMSLQHHICHPSPELAAPVPYPMGWISLALLTIEQLALGEFYPKEERIQLSPNNNLLFTFPAFLT